MTADRPLLVRPRFLKWSVVVFVLLLPFVIHSVWDYVETQRLAASIARIRARHEPLTVHERLATGDAAVASRLYRAAAALASLSDINDHAGVGQLQNAFDEDAWPDSLVARLRTEVDAGGEALELLDRANRLEFTGFELGTGNPWIELVMLASARTRLLAVEDRGNLAADAFISELRLRNVLDDALGPWRVSPAAAVQLIVDHSHPDADALVRLAIALRAEDRDDRLKVRWLRTRSAIFDGGRFQGVRILNGGVLTDGGIGMAAMRPWLLRQLNDRIDTLGVLIDRASGPWPSRIDLPASAYSDSASGRSYRLIDTWQARRVATDTALIRCARVVVAFERYRLAHGTRAVRIDDLAPALLDAVPIDPFSGAPLRYAPAADGYVVYSVGMDGKDDGGRVTRKEFSVPPIVGAPPESGDLGIRISQR